ncbi:hypothetical protein QOL99_08680 [Deinococcus sp. MIMF12]|uniref:Uncharacterized protein n=1 Tax=Deinococcus rhizophilus TaxID=3049544 RepID=A0ABT7JGN8_9DEIO|nr:hypothetical protein [Deinococcus rhizophilus]MDL2344226.1 hypothetical protein [Deinococcus rhizophilus]
MNEIETAGAWGAVVSSAEMFPDLEERPRLLLGVLPGWLSRDVQPGKDRRWLHLRHQAGGVNCTQMELVATELTPRPEREAGLLRLSLRFYDSNLSGWGTTVDDLVIYRAALRELLGVDANLSYGDLREAIYPVDVTAEHLRHLTSDELPTDLDELLTFTTPITQVSGMLNRWRLWIVTQNSD